jgi:large subunit ribosomal protein L5
MPTKHRVEKSTKGTAETKDNNSSSQVKQKTPKSIVKSKSEVKATPRILLKYREEIGPTLFQEFQYKNHMEIPKLQKVVLNIGLGETLTNPKAQERAVRDLTMISGQKPIVTRAAKSIAGFKLREGMPIGVKVTLRGKRMFEFMDRLLNISLPRIRDFRGLSRNAGDGMGNYTIGLREQFIFPEIDYSQIDKFRGLQITIVTTAKTNRECIRFLELIGAPFTRLDEETSIPA